MVAVVAAALVAYSAVDDAPFGLRSPQVDEGAIKVQLPAVGTAEPTPDGRSRTRAGDGVEVALAPPAGGSVAAPVAEAPLGASRGGSAPLREGGTVRPSPTTEPAPAAPTPFPATSPPDTPPPPSPAAPPAVTPEPTPSPAPPRRVAPPERAAVPEPEDEQGPIEEILRQLIEAEPDEPPEVDEPVIPDLPVLPEQVPEHVDPGPPGEPHEAAPDEPKPDRPGELPPG